MESIAELLLQKGAEVQKKLVFPMSNIKMINMEVIFLIHSHTENFRVKINGVDNMGYSTSTVYQSSEIRFNNGELSMENVHSYYPEGVKRNKWKLISWPGQPKDIRLSVSELEKGHVFYDWNWIKNKYETPKEIHLGKAYWFRHIYNEPVLFQEDTSTALS